MNKTTIWSNVNESNCNKNTIEWIEEMTKINKPLVEWLKYFSICSFFPRYIFNKSNKMVLWNVWKREWEKHIHFDYKRYLSSTTISSLWIFLHLTSSHWLLYWWLYRERTLVVLTITEREKDRIKGNETEFKRKREN